MSARAQKGNGVGENDEVIVTDAIGLVAEVARAGVEPAARLGPVPSAGAAGLRAGSAESVRSVDREFRTRVGVGGVVVVGVLPAGRLAVGSVAVSGDVQRLSCDQALELADALMLVVMRMDVVAERRDSQSTDVTRGREDWALRSRPAAAAEGA